jgi:sugar lactone lactonase YvrE
MKTLKTTVLVEGFFCLRAARWHAGTLWMSDQIGRKVYCLDSDGKAKVVAEVPEQPWGLGFLPDGTALVASVLDRRLLRLERDRLVCYVDLSSITAGALSDMIVDRHGRAYVASLSFESSSPQWLKTGCVILVTADGRARVVADKLVHPKGLVITGNRQLLIAETLGNRVTSFQIADDGALMQRTRFANFEQMSPEGICLDAEGAIWTAAARQPLFVRIVEGGQITHRIHVPGRRAVACQLGGRDSRTLFCLTLASHSEHYSNRSATARVETTLVDVPGSGTP